MCATRISDGESGRRSVEEKNTSTEDPNSTSLTVRTARSLIKMVGVDISRPLHIEGIDFVTADVAGKRRRAVCRNSHPRAAACLAQRVVRDQAPSPKVCNGFHLEVGGA